MKLGQVASQTIDTPQLVACTGKCCVACTGNYTFYMYKTIIIIIIIYLHQAIYTIADLSHIKIKLKGREQSQLHN